MTRSAIGHSAVTASGSGSREHPVLVVVSGRSGPIYKIGDMTVEYVAHDGDYRQQALDLYRLTGQIGLVRSDPDDGGSLVRESDLDAYIADYGQGAGIYPGTDDVFWGGAAEMKSDFKASKHVITKDDLVVGGVFWGDLFWGDMDSWGASDERVYWLRGYGPEGGTDTDSVVGSGSRTEEQKQDITAERQAEADAAAASDALLDTVKAGAAGVALGAIAAYVRRRWL